MLSWTVRDLGLVAALASMWALCSCSNDQTATQACTQGATQSCLAATGCEGVQVCASGGNAWGACACFMEAGVSGTASDGAASDGSDAGTDAGLVSGSDAGLVSTIVVGALLIDNQSSLLGQISLANGGYWSTFGSPGAITPPPSESYFFAPVNAGAFSNAACVSGTGITGPNAGEAFVFQATASNGERTPFDAGAYSGVSFYIMSPDAPETVVYFQDTDTDREFPGATCAGGADAGPVPSGGYPEPPCGNGPVAVIPLSAQWQLEKLPFAGFASSQNPGFYVPPSLDAQGLIAMGFEVENPNRNVDGGAPLSFHLCVAQIYFTQ